ncbi:MAG: phenylalanine--tRNA ligase subunit beta [Dehalococcoidales bacterium]
MKVSLNWLKQYVDVKLPAAEIANRLTLAGIEVKSTNIIGADWEGIIAGQILAVQQHPNADRLHLVTLDLATRTETVVCGAPNVAVGAKIAYAPIGTKMIDGHTGKTEVLKPAKIRGVASNGMCCSEKELGISENHEGIIILPADTAVGTPLIEVLGDAIFNLEVTPNRPDCLGMTGLAREIAATTNSPFHLPEAVYAESEVSIKDKVTVEIQDPDLCPRYCASLITGIKIGPSPEWMQKRLISYGMHPINNIVDITNFVMLEYAQPLHAFDYEKIQGKGIIVRRANSGEKITSLDGVERNLNREMLVIADKERAVAVAGIMGGANSEVSENTTSILLESASFKPTSVHYTGRTLNMPSEACVRFERGISPELTVPALKRATQLMVGYGGGQAAQGIIDVYPGKTERKPLRLTTAEFKRTMGVEYTLEQIETSLTALGFTCQADKAAAWVIVRAPYWRSDINIPVDVIEEVARIQGYEQIPTTLLAQAIPMQKPAPVTALKRRVRNMMAGYGFQELVSFSLTNMDVLVKLSPEAKKPEPLPVHIANPASSEQEYLRPNLRAGLLAALTLNKAFIEEGLRLFELGKVYLNRNENLPEEPDMLCAVICGPRAAQWWQGASEPVDFFDAKGVVEGLLKQTGIAAKFEKSDDTSLHPLNQAAITAGGKQIGVVGEVHPAVKEHFELTPPVFMFEINIPALLPLMKDKVYRAIPKFPATVRDVALVVDSGVTHQQILDTMKGFSLVTEVALFDVYAGGQIPAGKKSMAYRLTFQSPDKTLTDQQVNGVQQAILKKLAMGLGATLRG